MNFLQEKQAKLMEQAEYAIGQTNDVQVVKAFLGNRLKNVDMTDTQRKKMERWQFAYAQRTSGKYTDVEVRTQLVRNYNISEVQAIRDMRDMEDVYTTVLSINKQFLIATRIKLLEIQLQKAAELNRADDYAKLEKVMFSYVALLPDTESEVPGDYFTPHTIVNQFNPKLINRQMDDKELKEVLATLKTKYGFDEMDLSFIQDAEILEEDGDSK